MIVGAASWGAGQAHEGPDVIDAGKEDATSGSEVHMRRGSGTMSADARGSDEEGKRQREMGAGIDRFCELVDWSCTYADSEDSGPDESELTEWHVHDWAGRCEEWGELNKLATQDESLIAPFWKCKG